MLTIDIAATAIYNKSSSLSSPQVEVKMPKKAQRKRGWSGNRINGVPVEIHFANFKLEGPPFGRFKSQVASKGPSTSVGDDDEFANITVKGLRDFARQNRVSFTRSDNRASMIVKVRAWKKQHSS